MGKKHRRKGKSKREPPRCPLCEVPLDEQARCAACGLRLLQPTDGTAGATRVELAGRATAITTAPPAEPDPGAPGWRQTHDLALRTGRTIRLLTADDTERFCDPAIEPDHASAVEAVVHGELSAGFAEHHGGLRDAAERMEQLRASALSLGPGAEERLQRGLEHHDLRADPAAHSMAAADEDDRRHSDKLRLWEREGDEGDWGVKVRLAGSPWAALGLLPVMLGVCFLGGIGIWQVGKTAGPSVFYYATIAVVGAVLLLLFGVMLTMFRRQTLLLDAERLRERDSRFPWPTPRWLDLPVSELSHLVQRECSIHVALFSGEEHELLPAAEDRDRYFLRNLLCRRLELTCQERYDEQPQQPAAATEEPPTGVRRLLHEVGRLLYPVRHLGWLLPLLLPLTCLFGPFCIITETRPVWLEARRLANACPKVTERLGEDVTWAFGPMFTRDMEDGEAELTVKGDRRRGKMTLRFAVPVSEGVRLKRVDIEVDGDVVCAICCAIYGVDPKHTGGGPRRRR